MTYLSFLPIGIPASSRLVFRPIYPQEVVEVADEVHTGGKGDNADGVRRPRIFKPTGLLDRKATPTVQDRIDDSAQLHAQAVENAKYAKEVIAFQPIETMSQAEIDFEIGVLLHKKIRTEEDELLLLMLMMA